MSATNQNEAVSLLQAITALSESTRQLSLAIKELREHQLDENAHINLMERIDKVLGIEAVYSNDQIEEMIATGIQKHIDKPFTIAHAGWDTERTAIFDSMTSISNRVTSIEDWKNGEDGLHTEYEIIMKAIEDKHAPTISALQIAYNSAVDNGNAEQADSILKELNRALEVKHEELLQAHKDYAASNGVPV